MLVTGATFLGIAALNALAGAWRADLRIIATLREASVKPDDPRSVVSVARALPGVAALRYVGAEEALADLRRYLGRSADGLDRLPVNPLPARLEVTPAASLSAAELRALVERLERLPAIEAVRAAIGWVEPAERLGRGLWHGGLGLGAVLGLIAIVAVASATATARRRRADETAVLRLAGVDEGRLWAPLLFQALIQGALGASLGVGGLLLVTEVAPPWTGSWLRAGLGLVALPAPSWPLTAALLGGGLGLGLFGGLGGGRP